MPKDTQKRDEMERQLSSYPELDYQIWAATEGRRLSLHQLEYYGYTDFSEKYGKFGTLPAFGCSISHYRIYKNMIASDEKYSLILEDDAIISSDLVHYLNSVRNFLDNLCEPAVILLTPDFFYHKMDEAFSDGNSVRLVIVDYGYMTSGYIINRKGAELLANNLFPIIYIADEWASFKRFGLKVYGQIPHKISYLDKIGEIGASQLHTQNKGDLFLRLKSLIGRIKGEIMWYWMYSKGFRKSSKKW